MRRTIEVGFAGLLLTVSLPACNDSFVVDAGPPWDPCGGCADGLVCCFASAECVTPEECEHPPVDAPNLCWTNEDCPAGAVCGGEHCLGPGTCVTRENCPRGEVESCGCDGVTYPDLCTATLSSVRTVGQGACGSWFLTSTDGREVRSCADDADCPAEENCCALHARCMRTACETCCGAPLVAPWVNVLYVSLPCDSDVDCVNQDYCFSADGCDGPGYCVHRGEAGDGTCDLDQSVCGCNGRRYLNPCEASLAGTRVDPTCGGG